MKDDVTSLAALIKFMATGMITRWYEVAGDSFDTVAVWCSNPRAPTTLVFGISLTFESVID